MTTPVVYCEQCRWIITKGSSRSIRALFSKCGHPAAEQKEISDFVLLPHEPRTIQEYCHHKNWNGHCIDFEAANGRPKP
jgi:hypothetical protein